MLFPLGSNIRCEGLLWGDASKINDSGLHFHSTQCILSGLSFLLSADEVDEDDEEDSFLYLCRLFLVTRRGEEGEEGEEGGLSSQKHDIKLHQQ